MWKQSVYSQMVSLACHRLNNSSCTERAEALMLKTALKWARKASRESSAGFLDAHSNSVHHLASPDTDEGDLRMVTGKPMGKSIKIQPTLHHEARAF